MRSVIAGGLRDEKLVPKQLLEEWDAQVQDLGD